MLKFIQILPYYKTNVDFSTIKSKEILLYAIYVAMYLILIKEDGCISSVLDQYFHLMAWAMYIYIYFWSKVNIWNFNCARATAFIFDTRTGVPVKVSEFWYRKCLDLRGTRTPKLSDADQRKHQSSTLLVFVWGIHQDRWIPRTKGQLRGKCLDLTTSSCTRKYIYMYIYICIDFMGAMFVIIPLHPTT